MECLHYKLLNRQVIKQKNNAGSFNDAKAFQKPVTCKGSKLYIVKANHDILYVGITSQSISARLRYGFTAAGKHGYHGYKWKDHKGELDIFIWCFDGKNQQPYVEAIEAEVVFEIRKQTGSWPFFQTEIHFHKATNEQICLARKICNAVLEN